MQKNEFLYTVLISVYSKVDPCELEEAMDSMLCQTLPPAQVVLVKDGPLTDELDSVIERYRSENNELFDIVPLPENVGLGSAYMEGTKHCRHEYIAIMDSDDISLPHRCMREAQIFSDNPDIDIVGSSVQEFSGDISNITAERIMPLTHNECVEFAHKRCPCVHSTTMLKKSALIKAGGYRRCMYAEDYDLYVRMIMSGCRFLNLREPLVFFRVSDSLYARRGGIRYLKHIYNCKKNFYKIGFYSLKDFIVGISVHTIVCLMPNGLRSLIYKKLLRKSV